MEVQSAPLLQRSMSQEQNLIDIEDTIEVETTHEISDEYHLTELKSMGSEPKEESREEDLLHGELLDKGTVPDRTRELQTEDSHRFLKNLAMVVKRNKCFYDNEESSLRKLANLDFNTRMWQAVADQLKYSGSLDALENQWFDLKDSFANYLARNGSSIHDPHDDDLKPVFKDLDWLAPFVTAQGKNEQVAVMGSHIPLSRVPQDSHVPEYYGDQLSVGQDVMISGYQQRTHQLASSSHRVQGHASPSTSQMQQTKAPQYYVVRHPNSTQQLRIVNTSGSNAETGPRVAVIPSRSQGANVLHLQPAGQMPRNSHRIHSNPTAQTSSNYYERLDGSSGVPVSASGNTGMVGNMKKDVSLLLDQSSPYYNGNQKVYRLVMNDVVENNSTNGPPRKRIAVLANRNSNQPTTSQHPMQNTTQHMPQLVPLGNPGPSSSRQSLSICQLGDDVIDDGIQDSTVVIDDDGPESPLLSDSPMSSMMISGHQVQRHGHLNQRSLQHHSQQDTMMSTSPSPHPAYMQREYHADLQFQQLISTSLGRMDDNNKALAKYHIQKILIETRYEHDFCERELQDNEELDANGVDEHELVQ